MKRDVCRRGKEAKRTSSVVCGGGAWEKRGLFSRRARGKKEEEENEEDFAKEKRA